MVIYYCDGSMANGIIGVGIVRFIPKNDQKETYETYSYQIRCNSNKQNHERMAIKKVLELASKKEEKGFVIVNDHKHLVRKINDYKGNIPYLDDIITALQNMKAVVRSPKKGEGSFIRHAHCLSRTYLNSINRKSYSCDLEGLENFQLLDKNRRSELQKVIEEQQLTENLNFLALKNSNKLFLTKCSKTKWVALNDKGEPIFASKDILQFAEVILSNAIKFHDKISVNESFLKVFLEFIHSGTIWEKERLETANVVKNLLTSSTVHLYKMSA